MIFLKATTVKEFDVQYRLTDLPTDQVSIKVDAIYHVNKIKQTFSYLYIIRAETHLTFKILCPCEHNRKIDGPSNLTIRWSVFSKSYNKQKTVNPS